MAKEQTAQISEVLNLYKKRSETPLQTIERFVASHKEYGSSKMTYAGRLDPMAEGVLIVLTGEKNKERDAYTGLDKDYEFEFVLGIDTDTHDILGKLTSHTNKTADEKKVSEALLKYIGSFVQKYPAYSSKVVDGVPLFDHARKGKITNIVMPEHEVSVSKIGLLGKYEMSKGGFQSEIEGSIKAVKGDFRQKEIMDVWNEYFEKKAPETFIKFKAIVSCGSGFYVRQLVSDLGRDLGTGAVTTRILRTRVGKFLLEDSQRQ